MFLIFIDISKSSLQFLPALSQAIYAPLKNKEQEKNIEQRPLHLDLEL